MLLAELAGAELIGAASSDEALEEEKVPVLTEPVPDEPPAQPTSPVKMTSPGKTVENANIRAQCPIGLNALNNM